MNRWNAIEGGLAVVSCKRTAICIELEHNGFCSPCLLSLAFAGGLPQLVSLV